MNEIHLSLVDGKHQMHIYRWLFCTKIFFKQYEYALYGAKNGNQVLAQCMIIILSFQEIFLWQIYIKNKPNGAKTESVMTLYGAKTEIRFGTIWWYMYHMHIVYK